MAKLVWDAPGEHFYETGVSNCALYLKNETTEKYDEAHVWNGITSITESPSGAEPNPLYADDIKYLSLQSLEEFGASIEAYTYPKAFEACDGTATLSEGVTVGQQNRKPFGLAYKTIVGNDDKLNNYGYKLHLIYGCQATPSEKGYQTISDSPEPITFSWEISTTPVPVSGMKPTSVVTIDSTTISAAKLTALEAALFGTENGDPELLLPDKIKELLDGVSE